MKFSYFVDLTLLQMILMSGLSRSATEDLCSEKISDDRIPHICNLLRFAVLKKDRSLMAIGGPWDAVDGGDPSLDDSSLIHTVLRFVCFFVRLCCPFVSFMVISVKDMDFVSM